MVYLDACVIVVILSSRYDVKHKTMNWCSHPYASPNRPYTRKDNDDSSVEAS